MNKKKCKFANKGFTLVEIIVAIAIAGVVSLIALKLFSFSNDTLNKTEDRSFNQMSVRNSSIAITDRVRYAKELQLLNSVPSPILTSDEYDYIYFSETDKSLIISYKDDAGVRKEKKYLTSKLNSDIEKSYFLLEADPAVVVPPKKIEQITFEVTGKGDKYKDDNKDYKIKTTVNLVNSDIPDFAPKPGVGGFNRNTKYKAIKYK